MSGRAHQGYAGHPQMPMSEHRLLIGKGMSSGNQCMGDFYSSGCFLG
jgi:hypothetical protein